MAPTFLYLILVFQMDAFFAVAQQLLKWLVSSDQATND